MAALPLMLAPSAPDRTKVVLRFSCRDLPKMDLMSETDPQLKVYLKDRSTKGEWKLLGATEVLENEPSPDFAKTIPIDYIFEQTQDLKIECIDIDSTGFKSIGHIECTLGDVIGSKRSKLIRELVLASNKITSKPRPASISVTAEELPTSKQSDVCFTFRAENLDKKDFFGKSDPLLEIHRKEVGDGDSKEDATVLLYRTEYVKKELSPKWKTFEIPLWSLAPNSDETCPLLLRVWDWNKDGKYSFIGEVMLTMGQLRVEKQWTLVNEKKKKKKGDYKGSGSLHLTDIQVKPNYSFVDYLMHGLQMNLVVGIDYTGSNGTPTRKESLHFIGNLEGNSYQRALSAVSAILLQYDYDGLVPMYGFGGLMPDRSTSHCFPVNNNPKNPNVLGVQGLLDAYKQSFTWVKLDGPTNFAPLIHVAAQQAKEMESAGSDVLAYLILLIITDGEICDMNETIDEIIIASSLPMSIVIIGVGKGPFDNMDELDSDDELLEHPISGETAERDIVQFVHFDPYADDPTELAVQVLAEIPGQVTDYYKSKGIFPRVQT
jgi:hypothetical protein